MPVIALVSIAFGITMKTINVVIKNMRTFGIPKPISVALAADFIISTINAGH